jgi:hypothetical protein
VTHAESNTGSGRFTYWAAALRFYAKEAFLQSAVIGATALLLPPLLWFLRGLLHGFQVDSARGTLVAMAIGVGIGGAFFVGMLGTAIGFDLKKNWGQSEPTIEWNPLLFWKLFLYVGALMLLTFAFLSYRQGWWLSVEFSAFAILCWSFAHGMAVTVRLPGKTSPSRTQAGSASTLHGPRPEHWAGGHLHPGFVGMEYFALILNRSSLVFITDEGLHGWKFHGTVSSMEPLFYEPVLALLDEPEMTPGSQPFRELMNRRHTFFMPYAEIKSVEFVNRQKWGMGPIPHAGRLRLQFRGHRLRREFILLGNAHGAIIQDMIASRIRLSQRD